MRQCISLSNCTGLYQEVDTLALEHWTSYLMISYARGYKQMEMLGMRPPPHTPTHTLTHTYPSSIQSPKSRKVGSRWCYTLEGLSVGGRQSLWGDIMAGSLAVTRGPPPSWLIIGIFLLFFFFFLFFSFSLHWCCHWKHTAGIPKQKTMFSFISGWCFT